MSRGKLLEVNESAFRKASYLLCALLLLNTAYLPKGHAQNIQDSAFGVSAACDTASPAKIGKGAFPRWSGATNLITFTQEINNQFEVFTMKPDGTSVKCLTCGKSALAITRHRGQSSWHPNGKYIVFTAESAKYPRKGIGTTARPGVGRNHNVWIMTSDGLKFWQLTDYPDNWGVIEPFFSHDGTMLHWGEEFQMEEYPHGKPGVDTHPGCYWGNENITYRKGEELCSWRVKYAAITFDGSGKPTLSRITAVDPPDNFTLIESNGFTPDDSGFIGTYCDQKLTGGICVSGDIYTWDLNGNNLRRLTWKATYAHEDPYYSPDGNKIIFKCIPGRYPVDPSLGKTDEYWLMSSDGMADHSNPCGDVQLTHFNKPGYPEYDPQSKQNAEETWCPDGTCVAIGHVTSTQSGGPHIPSTIYKFPFEGACGKE